MNELINQLTSQLGIDKGTAESALQSATSLLKDNISGELFGKLSSSVPGLSEMVGAGAKEASSGGGGGLLGKLASTASSMLGDRLGGGLEMGAALAESGLPTDKLQDFIMMFVGFIKEKAGSEMVDQLLSNFPMLANLLPKDAK